MRPWTAEDHRQGVKNKLRRGEPKRLSQTVTSKLNHLHTQTCHTLPFLPFANKEVLHGQHQADERDKTNTTTLPARRQPTRMITRTPQALWSMASGLVP